MADGRSYTRANVPFGRMAGNYGPASKMGTALCAYTPNTPWAEINCEGIVDMDGAGTSSATPQVAAAAALWLQRHKGSLHYDARWKTVEAVRHALFTRAQKAGSTPHPQLGQGLLRARETLNEQPLARPTITPADSASFALIKGLFGLSVAARPRTAMLELELTQLIQGDAVLCEQLGDTDAPGRVLSEIDRRALVDRVVGHLPASAQLKEALKGIYPPKYVPGGTAETVEAAPPWPRRKLTAPSPLRRQLRGYAFDPQLSTELESAQINEILYDVRWEAELQPGPCGDYLDVIDYDPASGGFYQPVNLDDPALLAADGLAPSEGNPQFHQQMVYAVAMTTIERFERALGRRVLWSPRLQGRDDSAYVGQLRIYPHALRQQNAYYDPSRKALLFGYFPAADTEPGRVYPGGTVFTCLSQDIVAHETTHAILDGVHRSLLYPSNPDTLAFHEAFADIVALMQHFSMAGALRQQIARARGDLRTRNLLAELAVQFGQATGRYGALRSAIGQIDPETRQWTPVQPDAGALLRIQEPHARGSILVAAVFDAFLRIYERRTIDLLRIATGGSGVLPAGDLHPDLVGRLAEEAAKSAGHMLTICVRALDYCPPVDLTFGEYLRAIITADLQVVAQDRFGYRLAIVEAFRARGIYPKGLRSLAVDTLVWDRPDAELGNLLRKYLLKLRDHWNAYLYLDHRGAKDPRRKMFTRLRGWRIKTHQQLAELLLALDPGQRALLAEEMGLDLHPGHASFEVRSLNFSRKTSPGGSDAPQALVSIVQGRRESSGDGGSFTFRGGCTVILDLKSGEIDYVIRKNVRSATRLSQERGFRLSSQAGLAGLYLGGLNEADPSRALALLHGFQEEVEHG